MHGWTYLSFIYLVVSPANHTLTKQRISGNLYNFLALSHISGSIIRILCGIKVLLRINLCYRNETVYIQYHLLKTCLYRYWCQLIYNHLMSWRALTSGDIICQSIYLFVCLSICASIYPSIHLHLSINHIQAIMY